ncbi:hypothetical protein PFICI_06455 [Pestalotiopsis fici W106-1]|uniref:Cupin type-2 domain-containing protein n=1 Tax=Pestalotiopsis fici (strain W106-1 / CGMCC3.15140) TaxID=1229662 RepID=W3X5P8_PESFW|nr:uncharacterized protein PFICI_06455 [Pestalotiopsis fici W106-1]ETS81453.1 hypothetical protein PFICI_06455 [Pestalotiopsis fici W106-1]
MSPRRTNYAAVPTFSRPGREAVVYDLSVPGQATITLPVGSAWSSGPHWHESHTEFLQVLSGAAEVTLAGTVLPAVTAQDGVVTVPRGAVHEWRRSSQRTAGDEEELVVREWTDPRDGDKEVFFRNLNGMILDFVKSRREITGESGGGKKKVSWFELYGGEWMLENELRCLFWKCDNWPVLLRQDSWWPDWAQWVVTKTVLGASLVVGKCVGRGGVYSEYSHLSEQK